MLAKKKREQKVLEKLGEAIRALRQGRELSQEELAERAGVHRTYIGMIERGEKNVTILTMLRLSSALNVKVSEIMLSLDYVK